MMFQDLLNKQKEYIQFFFETVNPQMAQALLKKLQYLKGNLIFTGVGKSGQIAKKLASTFISTGTKAFYLHPVEALHGDLGMISEEDIVVFLSKSGNSKELVDLAKILYTRSIYQVLWACKEDSLLQKFMNLTCHLPLKRELCPYNLSPTTSPLLQMCFGDTLAIALMHHKEFSLDQYAENHPSGFIGTRSRKVKDVMLQGEKLPVVRANRELRDVLVEMSQKRLGCVLVVDEKDLLAGIFTSGDLNRALVSKADTLLRTPICELMTTKFLSIDVEERVDTALNLMQNPDKRVQMLPVLDGRSLVGLIHLHDVVEDTFQKSRREENCVL
jgi:arabinose-5-phosphate isomerase